MELLFAKVSPQSAITNSTFVRCFVGISIYFFDFDNFNVDMVSLLNNAWRLGKNSLFYRRTRDIRTLKVGAVDMLPITDV